MNLVIHSIRTKGVRNFVRRFGTVFTRFGFSERRIRQALHAIMESLQRYNGAPTFFIPAVVLARHPRLIAQLASNGAEIGIHGYVHNNYRILSEHKQYKQTQQAISVFRQLQIPFQGFRNPYFCWNDASLRVFTALGFTYESNQGVLHDDIDLNSLSPLQRSGFEKSLALFQAIPCSAYALRPHFEGKLLRIPASIPDDEVLFDRLRITNPQEVGSIWNKGMQRAYDLGGLYSLNIHPERGTLCRQALDMLLSYAHSRPLPVWLARKEDIAQWWKERSAFRMVISPVGAGRWRVEAISSLNATILARHLVVEHQELRPWHGADSWIRSTSFTVNAPLRPCIGISERTPAEVVEYMYEQGYPCDRCSREDVGTYAIYLDRPEGLGSSLEEKAASKIALVDEIEALERPFLRFGCWPDGNRAALCISGDIDSVTVQDFFLRVVEVFQHR
jgi:hypothetical protein